MKCSFHITAVLLLGISAVFAAGDHLWAAEQSLRMKIEDAALRLQMPGAGIEYRLPPRVFPPELVAKLRTEDVYRRSLYRSLADHAGQWTGIPAERWQELISDFAPVSVEGNIGNSYTMGVCLFTGKLFTGAMMTDDEFLTTPFQAKVSRTSFIIYAARRTCRLRLFLRHSMLELYLDDVLI